MKRAAARIRNHSRALTALLLAAIAVPLSAAAESPPSIEAQVAELKAENDRLRTLLPSQSHAMIDVAYHFLRTCGSPGANGTGHWRSSTSTNPAAGSPGRCASYLPAGFRVASWCCSRFSTRSTKRSSRT